jgi:hypothetical protein
MNISVDQTSPLPFCRLFFVVEFVEQAVESYGRRLQAGDTPA